MKIAFYCMQESFNKNNLLFENLNTAIGDDLHLPFIRLKEYAESLNAQVATVDIVSIDKADVIVFVDMPKLNNATLKNAINSSKPLYLLALESPLVKPENYDECNHNIFTKVFTWNDALVAKDSSKYKKINYSYDIPKKIDKNISNKSKLCCLIAGHKTLNYKNELYSERLRAIEWFEQNHLYDFDLYGMGWDEVSSRKNRYLNYILKRTRKYTKIFVKKHPSFKGKVVRKRGVLEQYKFSICYENAKDIPGYITEKIFDCFFAGCVPIYLGASNIEEYIPQNCFIDKGKFDTYDELYSYICNISEEKHRVYLDSIENYLNSSDAEKFGCQLFSKTIIDNIC